MIKLIKIDPLKPGQGISTELGKLYLWNPELAQSLVNQLNSVIAAVNADMEQFALVLQQVSTLSGNVDVMANALAGEIAARQNAVTELQQQINGLITQAQLNSAISAEVSARNSAISDAIAPLNAAIAQINAVIDTIKSELQSLVAELEMADGKIENLREDVDRIDAPANVSGSFRKGDVDTLSAANEYTNQAVAQSDARDMVGYFAFGRTIAATPFPVDAKVDAKAFDFTTNTQYKKSATGWDVGAPLDIGVNSEVEVAAMLDGLDISGNSMIGKKVDGLYKNGMWEFISISVGGGGADLDFDNDTISPRASDGKYHVSSQSFAITEDTDKFASQTAIGFKAFWQGCINKINGIISFITRASGFATQEQGEKAENAYDALDDKVDKVAGKGLSANDYTDEDKEKISKALILVDSASGLVGANFDRGSYEEYSNGKIDQRYRLNFGSVTSSSKTITIDLQKEMPDADYIAVAGLRNTAISSNTAAVIIAAQTAKTISVNVDIVNGSSPIWNVHVAVFIKGEPQ